MTDKDTSVYFLTPEEALKVANSADLTVSQALALLSYPDGDVRVAAIQTIGHTPYFQFVDVALVRELFKLGTIPFPDHRVSPDNVGLWKMEQLSQIDRDSLADVLAEVAWRGSGSMPAIAAFERNLSQDARDSQVERLLYQLEFAKTQIPLALGSSLFGYVSPDAQARVVGSVIRLLTAKDEMVRENARRVLNDFAAFVVDRHADLVTQDGSPKEITALLDAFPRLSVTLQSKKLTFLVKQMVRPFGDLQRKALEIFAKAPVAREEKDQWAEHVVRAFYVESYTGEPGLRKAVDPSARAAALVAFSSLSSEAQEPYEWDAVKTALVVGHTAPFTSPERQEVIETIVHGALNVLKLYDSDHVSEVADSLVRLQGNANPVIRDKALMIFAGLDDATKLDASRTLFAEVLSGDIEWAHDPRALAAARILPVAVDPDQFRQLMDSTDPALDAPRMAGLQMAGLQVLQQFITPAPDRSTALDFGGLS